MDKATPTYILLDSAAEGRGLCGVDQHESEVGHIKQHIRIKTMALHPLGEILYLIDL